MFRFTFALVLCLGLATPGHAFFEEILEAAETMLKEHKSDLEKGETDAKQIAKVLDERLAKLKLGARARVEKLLSSKLITPMIRQSLLDALSLLEDGLTQQFEEAKKLLATKEATVEPTASDL